MRELIIAGRRIADDALPYVIAEIGNNHQGDLNIAREMIRVAAECGASACKLQARNNATLYSPALLAKPYDSEHSFGPTYGAHRAALELSTEDLGRCFTEAAARHVTAFATAFDEVSADRLMALGVPAIKLASGALTDTALQQHCASFGVPIILSTGGGTEADVDRAVNTLWGRRAHIALLHTTASYPMTPEEANLRCILTWRKRYPDTVIGYSSHSTGIAIPLVAYALGASILEVHFTLDRSSKGTDHPFSLEPKGLATLVDDLGKVRVALGDGVKRWYQSERAPISKMRRRLTADGLRIDGGLD